MQPGWILACFAHVAVDAAQVCMVWMISGEDKQRRKLARNMNAEMSQHASGVTWLLYTIKKITTALYKLGVCPRGCSSVIGMKLTKTGSGWGVRRGRSRARQEALGSRMLGWGSARGAFFGSNFPEISLESFREIANCHIGKNSSRSEAWAVRRQSGSRISILAPDGSGPKADNTHINNCDAVNHFFWFCLEQQTHCGASAARQIALWADLMGKSANLEGEKGCDRVCVCVCEVERACETTSRSRNNVTIWIFSSYMRNYSNL